MTTTAAPIIQANAIDAIDIVQWRLETAKTLLSEGRSVEALEALYEATQSLRHHAVPMGVTNARAEGNDATWEDIGTALHMTRQSAHERFNRRTQVLSGER